MKPASARNMFCVLTQPITLPCRMEHLCNGPKLKQIINIRVQDLKCIDLVLAIVAAHCRVVHNVLRAYIDNSDCCMWPGRDTKPTEVLPSSGCCPFNHLGDPCHAKLRLCVSRSVFKSSWLQGCSCLSCQIRICTPPCMFARLLQAS